MSELKIFEHAVFGKIRIVDNNGAPWFVASDVAKALGYADAPHAVQQHCKKVNKISQQGNSPVGGEYAPSVYKYYPGSRRVSSGDAVQSS